MSEPTTETSAYDALSLQEQAYVSAYLETFNQAAAARKAKYRAWRSQSWRVHKRTEVQAAIKERLDAVRATPEEIDARLREIALGGLDGCVDGNGRPSLAAAKRNGKLHLLQEVTEGEHGLKLKSFDSVKALELLGKGRGMWLEKLEHTGPGGGPIQIHEMVVEMPPPAEADEDGDPEPEPLPD